MAMVEDCLESSDSLGELDWDSSDFLKCVSCFSKTSILHHYIFKMLSIDHYYDYRKNADIFEESPEFIKNIEHLFEAYNIGYVKFNDFFLSNHSCNETSRSDSQFFKWIDFQEDNFTALWEKVTDEVFYLLFANRSFLLKFNKALSLYIKSYIKLPPKIHY